MQVSQVFDVLGAIVVVAGITAVVSSPRSAAVIRELGKAFSSIYVGGIKASLGH